METIATGALKRSLRFAAPVALALMLFACSDGGNGNGGGGNVGVAPTPTPAPAPAPSPTPTPTPSPTSRNVSGCLNQVIPGTNGATTASLVIPDTIKIDLTRPAGFPNGRQLTNSVIDITLAALFLDVNAAGQSPLTFANLPGGGLNPQTNDLPFLAQFPFAAAPQGNPPLATGTGTTFNFRTDPATSYVRVDREGQPAVATAVIRGPMKNAYNDAGPAEDIAGTFVPEIQTELTNLHNALADDLIALGLKVCST